MNLSAATKARLAADRHAATRHATTAAMQAEALRTMLDILDSAADSFAHPVARDTFAGVLARIAEDAAEMERDAADATARAAARY